MGLLRAGTGFRDERVFRTLWIAASFFILIACAVFAVTRVTSAPALPFTPSTVPAGLASWQFFVGITASLALIGFLIRLVSIRAFFEIFLGATLFLGTWALAWFVFPWEAALLLASAFTILQARVRRVFVHDAFILLGCAGIAVHLAFIFPLKALAALLAAFFIYDLAAGHRGGAIVDLARASVRRGVVPGLIVPARLRGAWEGIAEAIRSPDAVFLGAGDFILPATIVVRSALSGVLQAVVVGIGILIGVLLLGTRDSLKPAPALLWLLPGAVIPYGIMMMLKLV